VIDLKNKRPMIPLQIDPPDHKKFRKLLDPIFAPRKMAAMDQEVSDLVNHLIDGFIERGEVDFAKEFSVPFPSEVFLTLLGLPMEELDTFLTMKDGIMKLATAAGDETFPGTDLTAPYFTAVRDALDHWQRGEAPPIDVHDCARMVRLIDQAYARAGSS